MRKTVPLVIVFITGVVLTLEYWIPLAAVQSARKTIEDWAQIMMAFAFVLGTLNILTVNLPRIVRRQPDWGYKLIMVLALFATLIVGFAWGPFEQAGTRAYWIYDNIYRPLTATMFSLLAFFIASAAFRAFRARSVEATLLLVTAVIVMIGRVPIGELISDTLPVLVEWINDVPNNAAKRAILMGAAVGAISTGVRIIIGIDRSYLSTGS